jgi:hypothetical protein
MKKLTEAMKQMLDALAYAHAGEYLTRREKARVLNQTSGPLNTAPPTPEPINAPARSNARRIALYLGSDLPSEVMEYVIQTCARLQRELTVLTFQGENTGRALLAPHREALQAAGVDMELVTLSGDPVSSLQRYLRGHPEVAFLACKDTGYLGHSYLSGNKGKNFLPVPVVILTTAGERNTALDQTAAERESTGSVVA